MLEVVFFVLALTIGAEAGHCGRVHPEVFLNLAVGPGPLVGVVVRVHLAEALVDCLDAVHLAGLYVVHQPHHLAARGNQAADIHPQPVSNLGIGLKHSLYIRIRSTGRQVLLGTGHQHTAPILTHASIACED